MKKECQQCGRPYSGLSDFCDSCSQTRCPSIAQGLRLTKIIKTRTELEMAFRILVFWTASSLTTHDIVQALNKAIAYFGHDLENVNRDER